MQGVDLDGNAIPGWQQEYQNTKVNPSQINSRQINVAVGPARNEGEWRSSVEGHLGLDYKLGAIYVHDKDDPVRYGTAPDNLLNSNQYYIPNPMDTLRALYLIGSDGVNIASGGTLYDAIGKDVSNIEKHSITNEKYSRFLESFDAERRRLESKGVDNSNN
jgi:hypothetical protein